jgi:seryl-tRNA synthetase
MIDITLLREEPDRVRQAMKHKGFTDTSLVDQIIELDTERRSLITRLQELQTASNATSKEIGLLMREGKREEAEEKKSESSRLKEDQKHLEESSRAVNETLQRQLLEIPNIPHPSVPIGANEHDNQVVWQTETLPAFDFQPVPHWDLIDAHGLIDFVRGAKVTGAGFPFYIGKAARLQRALVNFYLDVATREGGYLEIQPPIFVNADSATGTGQLPDKEDQMYEMKRDGLFAVPTAEVPVTNYLRGEILAQSDLPVKYCAYTPCFRREAGSYGKEVRGLNRLHQFDKVELVQLVDPEKSYEALEDMRNDAERVLCKLNIPYRRLLMCTGDMGFTQSKKYDLEVWSAGQERWLEVSSISNFEAFQARRTGIRFRKEGEKKPEFVHTLNGSSLAVPRVVAALLENGQQADGTIILPEALHPYTGFDSIG